MIGKIIYAQDIEGNPTLILAPPNAAVGKTVVVPVTREALQGLYQQLQTEQNVPQAGVSSE